MVAQVTALIGPAAAGKTESLLGRYRHALAERRPGGTLWLAPTFRTAGDIRSRLLSPQLSACFSPGVMTFDQFAEAVVQYAGTPIRPISSLLKRQILRGIVTRAVANDQLVYFRGIAATAGFLDLLEQFISELKRLEVWPEDFAAACQSRHMTTKDRELSLIYSDYQRLLNERQLYDGEGRFWSARACLRDGQTRPFENLRLVIVDGFNDFTTTQHEILSILSARVAELHVSLPLDPLRPELFRKTQQTLDTLRGRLTGLREASAEGETAMAAGLRHLERELFKPPSKQRRITSDGSIVFVHAASEIRELEWIAGRIKQLLTERSDTASRRALEPGEIAVVFRSLPARAELVREVFGEFGLPFALDAVLPLNRSRAITAIVSLLRLRAEDWPYRQLLGVLGNSFYQSALKPEEPLGALAAAERLIHELQIPRGKNALLHAIERDAGKPLPDATGAWDAEDDSAQDQARRTRDAVQALPLVRELAARLDELPRRASPRAWGVALSALGATSGLTTQLDAAETAAWQALLGCLEGQERLAVSLGENAPPMTDAELLAWIQDVVDHEPLPVSLDDTGRVLVLSAPNARNLRVRHLFFAGLSEDAFPQRAANEFYSQSELQRIRAAGLAFGGADERDDEEMLLFYEVATRATEQLYLSFAALDDRAQELLPTPYWTEVGQIFEPNDAYTLKITDPRPISDLAADRLCPVGFRTSAIASAIGGDQQSLAALLRTTAGKPIAQNIAAGLTMTQARRGIEFGPYEGLLASEAARGLLADRFGMSRVWNASLLEQYASCPFQFFAHGVLRLNPLAEIKLDLDPSERGRWLHASLASLHRRLNEEGGGQQPLGVADEARVREYYLASLGDWLERQSAAAPVTAALREITQRVLARWGEQYREQFVRYHEEHAGFESRPLPAHFEVSFGMATSTRSDRLSSPSPLELEIDGQTIRISGRVDRIDLGSHGTQTYFNIIDYKSGRPPKVAAGPTTDGLALQLDLYAMAVEQVLFKNSAIAGRAGYWSLKEQGYKTAITMCQVAEDRIEADPVWLARRRAVANKVAELIRGIQQGDFPVFSQVDDCTSYCAYRTVCRVNQTRALGKSWPPERA